MFSKMSKGWPTVETISTVDLTSFVISGAMGVLEGYRTYASPHTYLTESEKRLEWVRTQLERLSPEQRMEIEIATRDKYHDRSSLEYLEQQLSEYVILIDSVSFPNSSSCWGSLVSRICT